MIPDIKGIAQDSREMMIDALTVNFTHQCAWLSDWAKDKLIDFYECQLMDATEEELEQEYREYIG